MLVSMRVWIPWTSMRSTPAGELSIFVRDRSDGFDFDAIPEDRHGICDSIVERIVCIRGSAKIKSAPGEGAEVMLIIAS